MVAANSAVSLAMTNSSIRRRQLDQLRKQLRQTRAEMRRRVAARDRQIGELSQKIAEQDRTLGDLNRRIVEFDQRFDDVIAEVTRVRVTEDVRIKQKCISATDSSSTSSAGEVSMLKQSALIPGPETGSASATDFDHQRSVLSTKSESRKRKGSADVHEPKEKRSKNTDSPPAASDVRCLRSGRQMFCL